MKNLYKTVFGVSRNVAAMGIVSFLNDVASELVYPLVPLFITTILGASPLAVGVIEASAELIATCLKVFAGWWSDKIKKRKLFIVVGYSFSTLSKAVLAAATAWSMVFVARVMDRFGKGIRTAARDALIKESTPQALQGRAFGIHRALDSAGAVVGPLLAAVILQYYPQELRAVFAIAIIPSSIAVIILMALVQDATGASSDNNNKITSSGLYSFPQEFSLFVLISVIFSFGASSEAFLILRARDLGLPVVATLCGYALFSAVYSVVSARAGILSDRIGSRKILVAGFLLFAGIYAAFGFIQNPLYVWLLFALYGIYLGITDGVGKAYIARLITDEQAGTAFGVYYLATGVATFCSSLLAGALWTSLQGAAPFVLGSCCGLAAALLMIITAPFQRKS